MQGRASPPRGGEDVLFCAKKTGREKESLAGCEKGRRLKRGAEGKGDRLKVKGGPPLRGGQERRAHAQCHLGQGPRWKEGRGGTRTPLVHFKKTARPRHQKKKRAVGRKGGGKGHRGSDRAFRGEKKHRRRRRTRRSERRENVYRLPKKKKVPAGRRRFLIANKGGGWGGGNSG